MFASFLKVVLNGFIPVRVGLSGNPPRVKSINSGGASWRILLTIFKNRILLFDMKWEKFGCVKRP